MVFLVLNVIICISLIAFSFTIDSEKKSQTTNTAMIVNSTLFLAALFGLMAITLALCFYAPQQLALTVGKLTYLIMGWYCINTCIFLYLFPNREKERKHYIVQWILNIIAFFLIFFVKGGGISNISITYDNTFQIASGLLFKGPIGRSLMLTIFDFYIYSYLFFIPIFTCLMVLVRGENTDSIIPRQKINIAVMGVFATIIVMAFIKVSSVYQPMLRSLFVVGFIPELFVLLAAERNNEIWDKKLVVNAGIKFIFTYLIPSLTIALFFMLSWPIYSRNKVLFFVLFIIQCCIIFALWYIVNQFIDKKGLVRDSRYAQAFSEEIAAINFQQDSTYITSKLFNIFNKYVDSSSLKVVVDSGDGFFEYAYSSVPEDEKKSFEIHSELFDKLMNIKKRVIFKEFAQKDSSVAPVRSDLLNLFKQTDSDAFIMISEGHRLIGLITLGKKFSGNLYNEYDLKVFNNLYSNFFVIGYYMKNILNESVVGTVNKEIKMSAQIITSIQENMDRIKNEKYDIGYRMVPARNIGGEFVDIIRLTDTRYIYIIGSLSGKGIAASMNMVIMKSIIRTFLAETSDFKLLIQKVNTFIKESLPKGVFFSGLFGLMDLTSDTMYYINCGAPVLFLYTRAYNNVIEIQGDGYILGFVDDISKYIKVKKVKLAPGDMVFACTDGLIETKSLRGEKFGKSRIQNEMMDNSSYPADKIAQFAYESLGQFTSTQLEDDITIFMLKYLSSEEKEVKQ
ncbi:MAG: serine/threonine-protein phosphatase [Treponema sp.]|nr:serine/threonine-protein phosphatase [Treponema sp.]